MLARIFYALTLIVAATTVVSGQDAPMAFGVWIIHCDEFVDPARCHIEQSTGEKGSVVTATVTFNEYREPEIEIRVPRSVTRRAIALGFDDDKASSMVIRCDAIECRTDFRLGKGWVTQLLEHDQLQVGYMTSDPRPTWRSIDVNGLFEGIQFVRGITE